MLILAQLGQVKVTNIKEEAKMATEETKPDKTLDVRGEICQSSLGIGW